MTRQQLLLTQLAEECMEVAQRASKAIRFGIDEIQPGQELTNVERLRLEFSDLMAICDMLFYEGINLSVEQSLIDAKQAKVEKFLEYSRSLGVLE